jgi:hypothetical protein
MNGSGSLPRKKKVGIFLFIPVAGQVRNLSGQPLGGFILSDKDDRIFKLAMICIWR